MAEFAGHPSTFTFADLTMTRGKLGEYTVTREGIAEPIGSVSPYHADQWGWLHFETGRSGMVGELAAAGNELSHIEQSRS